MLYHQNQGKTLHVSDKDQINRTHESSHMTYSNLLKNVRLNLFILVLRG